MKRTVMVLCGVLALAGRVFAQGPAAAPVPIDVRKLGPQVGDRIGDFALLDQNGKTWTRDSLMGPNGLMLVFSRSADWCPFCKTQLAELQTRLPELARRGLGLAAVTYDSPAILSDFSTRRGITFPLLSDPGSGTIKRYGILNTTVDAASTNYGIPFPGSFIVDRRGVVTSRFFEQAYQERNTVSAIFLKLGGGGVEVDAQRLTTDHVEITTFASDRVVAPGTLFSLVADIAPKPGMHVYAPGAHSYKVVTLRLAPHPFLRVRPITYPAAEIYVFKPLGERVEVFQKPFRLSVDLTFESTPEARTALAAIDELTLTGAIDYQACDATTCYLSKSVPVAYHVRVRPLDTERSRFGQERR